MLLMHLRKFFRLLRKVIQSSRDFSTKTVTRKSPSIKSLKTAKRKQTWKPKKSKMTVKSLTNANAS